MQNVLDGLEPPQALKRIDGKSNCVWQLLNHIRYWRMTVVNRIKGSAEPPGFPDMMLPSDHSDASLGKTLNEFRASYEILRKAIAGLNESDLERLTPRGDQTLYQLLHGVIEHDCYHMGQMMIIKKYASSKP
jgi:uncharacterized damage-inducible protein DinB